MLLKKTVIVPLHGLNVLGYARECSKFPLNNPSESTFHGFLQITVSWTFGDQRSL